MTQYEYTYDENGEPTLKLYGGVSVMGQPDYDDIMKSDLPREEKVKQIKWRGQAYRDKIDDQLHKDYARIGLGGLVSAIGALPIAITKNPVIGSAIGGGVYELGQGIMEGDELPELMQRSGFGAAIGGAAGGVVSKAPQAAKFVNNLSGGRIGNALKPIGEKIAQNPAVQKAYDVLMTDIRAFNPNKQTVYHGSPYDFNKFSNEAIGTGEGAQAHGYGHYAALDKDVANGYRWQLNADTSNGYYPLLYKGERVPTDTKEGQLISQIVDNYKKYGLKDYAEGKEEIIEPFKNLINKPIKGLEHLTETAKRDLPIVENINPNDIKEWEGQLYKLSIPKDDVMLREGVRLDKQPKIVQDAFNQIRQEYLNLEPLEDNKTLLNYFGDKLGNANDFYEKQATEAAIKVLNGGKLSANEWQYLNNLNYEDLHKLDAYFTNGEDILKRLQNHFYDKNNKEQLAQKILYDKGIKGISYNGGIDGEARVIFNPDDIVIGRKYYNQPNLYEQLTGKQNTGALVDALLNR